MGNFKERTTLNWLFVVDNIWWTLLKYKRDKLFKSEPSKICGRQPLKNLKGYGLPQQTIIISSIFLKAVFYNLCLVPSWILGLKYSLNFNQNFDDLAIKNCIIQKKRKQWQRRKNNVCSSFLEVCVSSL